MTETVPSHFSIDSETGEVSSMVESFAIQRHLLPFFRTPYNFDRDASSVASALSCRDPSLTRQDDAEDADINVIVGRFLKTGVLPEGVSVPQYGDFLEVADYKSSLDLVRKAEQAFALYPADIRAQYANDVGLFLDAAYAGQVPGVSLSDNKQQAPSGPAGAETAPAAASGGTVQGPG